MRNLATRAYALPALVFLTVTVLMGAWMRAVLLEPRLAAGLQFRLMVHAHSHLAFFGWVNLALFALVVPSLTGMSQATSFFRIHALTLALASAAAFISFLLQGYGPASITLSVFHVALWFAFAVRVFGRAGSPGDGALGVAAQASPAAAGGAGSIARSSAAPAPAQSLAVPWLRLALGYLVLAGLATFAPLLVMLRGAADGWWAELAVKLFLIPFINGWVTLGVLGAVVARSGFTGGRGARWLIAAGALPATLLFVASPPPHAGVLLVGRAGTALLALGSVWVALALLRSRLLANWWLRLGTAALLLKGTIELLAALGVGGALMRSPPIVLAHLHLVLLGFVTASLLGVQLRRPARAAALTFATGVALMLSALVVTGWARLFLLLAPTGLDLTGWLWLALAGGVLAAAGACAGAFAAATDGGGGPVFRSRFRPLQLSNHPGFPQSTGAAAGAAEGFSRRIGR